MSDKPRLLNADDLRRGTLNIYMQPSLSIELKVVSAWSTQHDATRPNAIPNHTSRASPH